MRQNGEQYSIKFAVTPSKWNFDVPVQKYEIRHEFCGYLEANTPSLGQSF